MNTLNHLHDTIESLCSLIEQLDTTARLVQASDSSNESWRDSLLGKLRYQSSEESPLIIAVTGGTNIGKSTVFNHLAQDHVSGVCPTASGTKYPVCLVPEIWADEEKLRQMFVGFDVQPWSDNEQPLADHPTDVLYWRVGKNMPPKLILLDTPDIDSSSPDNWRRAEKIRQIADVLIAILTQQKYNDMACSRFFQQAAESGKQFIVVFNQVDLEEHAPYWPLWLQTFTQQVHQKPLLVYAAPHDRKNSADLKLPFFNVGINGKEEVKPIAENNADSSNSENSSAPSTGFQNELANLHFDELKTRSLEQSLKNALDDQHGLGAWINQIKRQSEKYALKMDAFSQQDLGKIEVVPLPAKMVTRELTDIWDKKRSSIIHSLYWVYSEGYHQIEKGISKGWSLISQTKPEHKKTTEELFLEQEREMMIKTAGRVFAQLEQLSQTDDMLGEDLKEIVSCLSIEQTLENIRIAHNKLPIISEDFRLFLQSELENWMAEHPKMAFSARLLDSAIGVGRPVLTIALAAFFVVGPEIVTQYAAAGAAGFIDPTSIFAKLFCNIQEKFCIQRTQWLHQIIQTELHLDDFIEKMNRRIAAKTSPEIIQAVQYKTELENEFSTITS